MVATAVGFLAFYAIEKLTAVHVGHETAAELDHGEAAHRHVGLLGAIGQAAQPSTALAAGLAVGGGLGLVIAIVVVVHRFSDGIGIVSLLVASRTPQGEIFRWVALVAIAPVVGVAIGLLLPMPDEVLGCMLDLRRLLPLHRGRRACRRRTAAIVRDGSWPPRWRAWSRSTPCRSSPAR